MNDLVKLFLILILAAICFALVIIGFSYLVIEVSFLFAALPFIALAYLIWSL